MRKHLLLILLFSTSFLVGSAQSDVTDKIKNEGLHNSKVMDLAFHLTDVSGPRLTNSPGFFRAANWAKDELTKMGLVNVALEPWGDFGKGWEQNKCYLAVTAPYYFPVIAIPRAWTGSTFAGIVAGCLFAFNAHLLTRYAHLQALHLEFLPAVFFAFDRVLRGGETWTVE